MLPNNEFNKYFLAADISDTEVEDYAEPSTSTFMDMSIDMNRSDGNKLITYNFYNNIPIISTYY